MMFSLPVDFLVFDFGIEVAGWSLRIAAGR